ncbi:MAG: tetratricopeptide repeat protein [Luteitalea sp.]|nr:tetratricopeptide repeat protein [Luteitalea sp.]
MANQRSPHLPIRLSAARTVESEPWHFQRDHSCQPRARRPAQEPILGRRSECGALHQPGSVLPPPQLHVWEQRCQSRSFEKSSLVQRRYCPVKRCRSAGRGRARRIQGFLLQYLQPYPIWWNRQSGGERGLRPGDLAGEPFERGTTGSETHILGRAASPRRPLRILKGLMVWSLILAIVLGGQVDEAALAREAAAAMESGEYAAAEEHYRALAALVPDTPEIYTNLGLSRFLQKKYDEAIEAFEQGLKRRPAMANAWLFLGISQFNQNRPAQAVPPLQKYASIRPDDKEGHYYLGLSLMARGRYEAAEKSLAVAKQLDPRNLDVLYHLAQSYLKRAEAKQGSVAELSEAYQSVVRQIAAIDPESYRIRQLRAGYYAVMKEPSKAIAELEAIVKDNPRVHGVQYTLGCLYMESFEYDQAMTAFEAELKLDSPYPRTYLQMGHVYLAQNKATEALPLLEKAVREEPENGQPWVERGRAHRMMGQHETAAAAFEEAIKLGERTAAVYYQLGVEYRQLGKRDLALEAMKTAKTLRKAARAPETETSQATEEREKADVVSAESLLEKGQRAFDMRTYEEALNLFEQASHHSSRCDIHFYIGLARYRLGRTDPAIVAFQSALACDGSLADAQVALGDAYLQRGDENRSLAAYEAVLRAQPDHRLALRAAAALYLKHELHEKTVPVLERLVELEPKDVQVQADLAAAYAATGRMQEAEHTFRGVLKVDPNHASALVGLGNVYLHTSREHDAIPFLKRAAALARSAYEPYYLLGVAHNRLGEYGEAATALEEARRLNPTQPAIYYQLGQTYRRLDRKDEQKKALAEFGRLKSQEDRLVDDKRTAARLVEQARSLVDSGKLQEAIELLEQAQQSDAESDRILFRLASLYYDVDRFDSAREHVDKAIAIAPSEWRYHYLLGLIEMESDEPTRALESFETVLELNANAAEAYQQIGHLAIKQRNLQRAIDSFKRAVDLDPENARFHFDLSGAYREAGHRELAEREKLEFERLSRIP